MIEAIENYRKVRGLPFLSAADPDSPLFTTSRGTRFSPSYLNQYMTKEMTKIQERLSGLEINITPHVFRHAFAITFRLNLETTQIYLEKVFAKERHAVNQWSEYTLNEFL